MKLYKSLLFVVVKHYIALSAQIIVPVKAHTLNPSPSSVSVGFGRLITRFRRYEDGALCENWICEGPCTLVNQSILYQAVILGAWRESSLYNISPAQRFWWLHLQCRLGSVISSWLSFCCSYCHLFSRCFFSSARRLFSAWISFSLAARLAAISSSSMPLMRLRASVWSA